MRPVAASLQPFNLGEFTAAPGRRSALRRWSGLILLSTACGGTTTSLRRFKPLRKRDRRAGAISLLRPIARAVRIRNGETEETAGQTLTDISWDKERDNAILDICAPKTPAFRGGPVGHGAFLLSAQ